jgi:hypothetical protein
VLAAGTVIAIEPLAFISGFSAEPRIDASIEAIVHFEDTSPRQIGTPPNVVAAPVLSASKAILF